MGLQSINFGQRADLPKCMSCGQTPAGSYYMSSKLLHHCFKSGFMTFTLCSAGLQFTVQSPAEIQAASTLQVYANTLYKVCITQCLNLMHFDIMRRERHGIPLFVNCGC
jgi:hypothetical protein